MHRRGDWHAYSIFRAFDLWNKWTIEAVYTQ